MWISPVDLDYCPLGGTNASQNDSAPSPWEGGVLPSWPQPRDVFPGLSMLLGGTQLSSQRPRRFAHSCFCCLSTPPPSGLRFYWTQKPMTMSRFIASGTSADPLPGSEDSGLVPLEERCCKSLMPPRASSKGRKSQILQSQSLASYGVCSSL